MGEGAIDFSERFERLLDEYRKPDGTKWTGTEIVQRAGGAVTATYLTSLRKGRIRKPGLDKLRAIAKVMGFPWQLWLEESEDWAEVAERQEREAVDLSGLLENLFSSVRNYRTGDLFTEEEVARLSGGELTASEVRAIRRGELEDPTMAQISALSDVFGVDPAYWFTTGRHMPVLDEETIRALSDDNARVVLQKSYGISDADRDLIIGILQRMGTRKRAGGS